MKLSNLESLINLCDVASENLSRREKSQKRFRNRMMWHGWIHFRNSDSVPKMYSFLKYVGVVFISINLYKINAEVPHKRFEYKCSFKPPYLAQRDGSVPFWTYGGSKYYFLIKFDSTEWKFNGLPLNRIWLTVSNCPFTDAIASADNIRLAPSLKSQKGMSFYCGFTKNWFPA